MVPYFDSVEAFRKGLAIKKQFGPVDLYPRDGCILLAETEARVTELMGAANITTVAYNSGMTAVCSAIDIALDCTGGSSLVIAFSYGLYKQTKRYIEQHIGKYGTVHSFDSGSTEDVEKVFDELKPDIIVTESVSNHINAPVLDIGHVLSLIRSAPHAPTLVIDNTLPLSTGLPLAARLGANDPVIVVESGTKSYAFNQELLGVAYTAHPKLARSLLQYRRITGTIPNGAGLQRIARLLPKNKKQFDERNRRLFKNTETLAKALHQAGVPVSHPALSSHRNRSVYRRDFPTGGTPVFYIKPTADCYEVADRLWSHPTVREHARLGQSFGFDETRILIDENAGAVRLAGGSETDVGALGPALVEAMLSNASKRSHYAKASQKVR